MSRFGVAMMANLGDENADYNWARGPAMIRDGVIYLDTDRMKPYRLIESTFVVSALANLHLLTDQKALEFVAEYGLLIGGSQQKVEDLAHRAQEFHCFVTLHQNLLRAVNGDEQALEFWIMELHKQFMKAVQKSGQPSLSPEANREAQAMVDQYSSGRYGANRSVPLTEPQRVEVLDAAGRILAGPISRRLARVRVGVTSEATLVKRGLMNSNTARSGVFAFEHQADNLLEFAFLRLAYMLADKAPLLECPVCNKFFEIGSRAKKHCSKACGSKQRKATLKSKREALNTK